jgi:predicted GIY-YIG superfamily endonuclease
MISDISTLAKQEHEEKTIAYQQQYETSVALLKKEYQEKNQSLADEYNSQKEYYFSEINNLSTQLKSLQQQKAATIEAFEREQAIKEQINLYRLDISEQDSQDIKFLQSIQYRISKPRVVAMLIWQTYYQPIAKKKFPLILGTEKVCGVYKITSIKNQKAYIGQAVDVRDRWLQHCKKGLGIDAPANNKLYSAMLEEGLENFTFELLETCQSSELNEKEKYYINLYNTCDYGYNLTAGNK